MFPFTGVELSEDVFEMLTDLFASPVSKHRQDSRGSEHRQDSRVPEAPPVRIEMFGLQQNRRSGLRGWTKKQWKWRSIG